MTKRRREKGLQRGRRKTGKMKEIGGEKGMNTEEGKGRRLKKTERKQKEKRKRRRKD